ncbi:twin transmembrane helix small protein [Polycladidibacter hongkongensis]|uniref:twin transmembrane helix small protein n=1 Tax=Polycladidibacter hongkongensis TaxID=1647556 RepID=UPI00082C6CC1|nr:twin transmembrane helix small protein [Pseudovibrio hongkongensis]
MDSLFSVLIPLSLLAVAVVLFLGLWNMMRGGSANRSQKLMRLRVLFQFCAVLLLIVGAWLARG